MPLKIFNLQSLQKFAGNTCIIYRDNIIENSYTYKNIIDAIRLTIESFRNAGLPNTTCFSLKLKKNAHTPSSIVLLLSILNYECYFYPLSDVEDSKNIPLYNVNYFISNDEITLSELQWDYVMKIPLFEEVFSLYKLKMITTNQRLPKDMCYIISTSGSTGKPKLVYVPYSCIEPNILSLCKLFNMTSRDVIFLGTPITFDPFVIELFTTIACGAALLITTSEIRLNPSNLMSILWKHNAKKPSATIVQMTPSLFRQFGASSIKNVLFVENSALRILILGGEEFPNYLEIKDWLPMNFKNKPRVFNIYGITELSCWSSIYECCDFSNLKRIPLGESIDSQTILKIDILTNAENDDTKIAIEHTERGELLVGSSRRKTFIPQEDNMYSESGNKILYRRTGDVVERQKDGQIFYIGRLNNIVKRFGKRICLDALEQRIESLLGPGQNVKVICLWEQSKQKLYCCLKICQHNSETKDKRLNEQFSTLKWHIMSTLKEFEKPDRFIKINEIFLNQHGKVDRNKLLDYVMASKNVQPIDIFKRFLHEVFNIELDNLKSVTEHCKKRKIGENEMSLLTKSFTEVGGTSFQALSLATEIGEILANPHEQRDILEKFLNSKIILADILEFLGNVTVKECHDPTASSELKSSVIEPRSLQFLWCVNLEKCIDATVSMNIDRHYICIGSHANIQLTVDVFTGQEVARLILHNRIECEVAFISKDMALVGCNSGYLYCFNIISGNLEWKIHVGEKIKAKPLIIQDEMAIIGCYAEDFNIVCLDLKTQQIKWRKKIGHKPIFSSPLQFDQVSAIVCTLDGSYELLKINTGNALWTHKCNSPIFSTPAIPRHKDYIILAEVNGKVHLCNALNGEISFIASGNIFSNISLYDVGHKCGQIIFGCHDHNIYCLSYKYVKSKEDSFGYDLKLNWKSYLDSAIYATPIVLQTNNKDFIISCSTKGLLSILDMVDGTIVTTYTLKAEIFSSPRFIKFTEDDIRIFFGCRDNFLYCFRFNSK